MSFPRRLSLPAGAGALAVLLASVATLPAIHPKNAGPETFEIKFRLPPPKPLSPREELATFKLPRGFHAELVAAEPMVDTPIDICWDERGRMFVCEMRGYMHDIDGAGEDQPTGRVVMLEDTDGDGKMDKQTVFADGLFMPRSVTCVNGGLLVGEPPNLWFLKDMDGDGKADVKELVDSHYGVRGGQPEHMANSPTWFLDNWIYCAVHPARFRLKDGKFISESAPSRGQWGLSQDDYGRPYYNFNSDFLRANFVPESYYARNPDYPGVAGTGVQIMTDQHCWPGHPTPGVNRGYEPEQLRADGSLATCTATCGPGVYRAGLFPEEFRGNVFIPEPAGNMVKRVIIDEKNAELAARNAYDQKEFLTSTDERFRPVNVCTGPDGALYVVDMYRGVLEHKLFLTHYLIGNIKDRKLEEPLERGRIWRIVPNEAKPKTVKLPEASVELVKSLSNANGWVRDTAQRVLVERKDSAVAPALAALAHTGSPLAKLHALWTLEGIGALTPEVTTAALHDANPKVRANAVRVADRTLAPELAKLVGDPSADVQIALGFAISPWPESEEALGELGRRAAKNPIVRDAMLSGLRGRELELLRDLLAPKAKPSPNELLAALAQAVLNERRAARVTKLVELIAAQPEGSPVRMALLEGASGKGPAASPAKPKLLYLEKELPELAQLKAASDPQAKVFAVALDARLAWPKKPGVPPPPVIVPLTAEQQKLYDGGKTVYATLCAACHQPTGVGMPGLAPALVDSNWVLGQPEILPRIVLHGVSGPLKVNNQSWSLEMPPLGAALSDEQIAGVLTYIRREWEHNGSPINVQTVANIRERNIGRTKAWSEAELTALSAPPPAKK